MKVSVGYVHKLVATLPIRYFFTINRQVGKYERRQNMTEGKGQSYSVQKSSIYVLVTSVKCRVNSVIYLQILCVPQPEAVSIFVSSVTQPYLAFGAEPGAVDTGFACLLTSNTTTSLVLCSLGVILSGYSTWEVPKWQCTQCHNTTPLSSSATVVANKFIGQPETEIFHRFER